MRKTRILLTANFGLRLSLHLAWYFNRARTMVRKEMLIEIAIKVLKSTPKLERLSFLMSHPKRLRSTLWITSCPKDSVDVSER